MPTMTALSIKAPWSRMIRDGEKTIEIRNWYTSYRGSLLICSSRTPDKRNLRDGEDPGPLGMALCIADLVICRQATKDDEVAACCVVWERDYAFVLANIRPLAKPFPVKGKLGLFKVEVPEGRL